MIRRYNKLVRDRIPEIIEVSGNTCVTEILSDEEYLRMLDIKLDEELAEYHADQDIEELADLIEVIRACAVARGYTLEQLEQVRADKAVKRGGFEKKILLKKVIAPDEEQNLLPLILQNQSAILSQLDAGTLATYRWLQENLHCRNVAVDLEYRRKFSGYYGMRFVSQEYRDRYFQTLEKEKNNKELSFQNLATELYAVDGKHEFSFLTKMLHTIDPCHPIYDSRVEQVLKLGHRYGQDFEKRLGRDEQILSQLTSVYRELASTEQINPLLSEIDARTPGFLMTVEKKMDFILWALGGVLR